MLKMNQSSFSFNFHSAQLLKHPNRVFYQNYQVILNIIADWHNAISSIDNLYNNNKKKTKRYKEIPDFTITLLKRKSLIFFNVSLSSKQFLNIKTILNQPETRNVPDKKAIVNTKCDTLQLETKIFNPQHGVKEK